jgi:ATP-dependent DNA ligase
MHPTLVREPFHRDGWVYEEKVDGSPTIAYKYGTDVRLVSRSVTSANAHRSRYDCVVGAP